jgi:predicted enzyme involved in methoxymalonyl-ACP biosynthesis
MGRNIEETMLALAMEHGRTLGSQKAWAKYIATDKNKPYIYRA